MATTVSDLGRVNKSLQVTHIEAVGHGGSAGQLKCNGNITSTAGVLTLSKTSSQIVLGTTNTVTISSTAPSASRTYTIPDVGASCNVQLGLMTVLPATVGGALTLTAADSGKLVTCGQAIANGSSTVNVINLPAVASAAGFRIRVLFTAVGDNSATHNWWISSTAANMKGTAIGVVAAPVGVTTTGITTLKRSHVAADALAGDWAEFYCDGTNYFYHAFSNGTATPWSTA